MVFSRKPPRFPVPPQVEGRYSRVSPNIVNKQRAKSPTQEFEHQAPTQVRDAPLGDRWMWTLAFETFWRNYAVACALELYYRVGRADEAIAQARTQTRPHCDHTSVARFANVGVCTACLTAVDRIV